MNQQTASRMLQVTGILCIIGGALSVLGSIGLLFTSVLFGAAASSVGGAAGAALGGLLIIAVLITLVASAAELIAGILGVVNCKNPDKANICFIFGIINVAIGLISIILSISSSNFNFMNIITSLALPILYTIAAYFLKNTNNGAQY